MLFEPPCTRVRHVDGDSAQHRLDVGRVPEIDARPWVEMLQHLLIAGLPEVVLVGGARGARAHCLADDAERFIDVDREAVDLELGASDDASAYSEWQRSYTALWEKRAGK